MNELKQKLEKTIEHMKQEIASLRTGRATSALVEDLEVEQYGSKMPLKGVAAISTPDARQIVIQPWDKSVLPAIEKAIQSSSLGLNPIADRDVIRLSIPPLNEERRKELVKMLGQHLERARIQVRKERDEALKSIDHLERDKKISEDEKFRQAKDVQKIIDEINKKIEEIAAAKEKEIMTV